MSEYLENALVILSEMAEAKKMKGKDPCWDGYEMIGTKKKNGKEVPNCVPKNEEVDLDEAKVGDTVSFHHELKAAPGTKMKKSGTVEKIENDTVHVKVKDKYGVKRHQIKMSDIVKEEVEQVDELNKDTVYSYSKKSASSSEKLHTQLGKHIRSGNAPEANKTAHKLNKRLAGQERADARLNNEEVEAVDEGRWVTPKEAKPPKSLSTVSLKQLIKNKKENPGQSPFKTQDDKVKKHLGLKEQDETEEVDLDEAKGALTYTPKATKYAVIPDGKKQFVKQFDKKEDAEAHAQKHGGKVKSVDQSGRTMKEESEIDLNQLFTEAMKKDEESSKKKVIKKGEQLSGKQEVVKVHPEIPNKN